MSSAGNTSASMAKSLQQDFVSTWYDKYGAFLAARGAFYGAARSLYVTIGANSSTTKTNVQEVIDSDAYKDYQSALDMLETAYTTAIEIGGLVSDVANVLEGLSGMEGEYSSTWRAKNTFRAKLGIDPLI